MLPLNLYMSKYCFASVKKKKKREMHPRMKRAQIEGEKGAKPPLLHTQAVPQRVFCVCTVRVCVHARVFVCIWVLVLYKVGTGLQKDADSVRFFNQIKKTKQKINNKKNNLTCEVRLQNYI